MHPLRWPTVALLLLTALPASADDKPNRRLDLYGDPLPEGAVARLGTVRLRARCAWCVAFSHDGKWLAAGSSWFTAGLWDTATWREVVRTNGDKLGEVHQVALSPDGSILATLDKDRGVRLWDARTGKHLRQVQDPMKRVSLGTPYIFTFSPDSRTLYTGFPTAVSAFGVADGKAVALPAAPERGLTIDAVAPDGAAAVSVADGGRLVVWDLKSGKSLAEVAGPRDHGFIALAPGAKRLAVETKDNPAEIVVWDLTAGKELCHCKGHEAPVSSMAFAPDGKTLATGAGDLTARLWDLESGKERWSYRGGGTIHFCVNVAFSPDGKAVGAAGWDGIVRVLDAATGKERLPLPGHLDYVNCLAVTPDGRTVFTSSEDGSLCQWDIATGKQLRLLKARGVDTHDPKKREVIPNQVWIGRLDFTPDGKALVVDGTKSVGLWDVSDPERPRVTDLDADSIRMALAPDGKTVATFGQKLRLLDVRTRAALRESEAPDYIRAMHISPDGRTLALGCREDVVRLYDVRTWQERAVLKGGGVQDVYQLAFSPDGQLLASAGMDWRVNVWEVATGQLRRRIEGPKSMPDVPAFSPDGRYLALGGMDESISFHELSTGRVVPAFRWHEYRVTCLAFTPDGRRLLSGGQDGAALVWDMQAVPSPAARVVKWTPKELDELSKRLVADADKADEAMRDLAASPEQTVALISRFLKPVEKDNAKRIAQLVRDLDSDSFDERERASAALKEMGEDAAEALRAVLAAKRSVEVRRRAEELLDHLKSKKPSPERLRGLRAVQVLEWVGTPEARRALEAVAAGAPDAERTRAAAVALDCLKKR